MNTILDYRLAMRRLGYDNVEIFTDSACGVSIVIRGSFWHKAKAWWNRKYIKGFIDCHKSVQVTVRVAVML